uniref:Uncharacterized protein n=1 Tax=Arundo donax TaxID=35708 RepID=A0A0A9ELM2_ARUDO
MCFFDFEDLKWSLASGLALLCHYLTIVHVFFWLSVLYSLEVHCLLTWPDISFILDFA